MIISSYQHEKRKWRVDNADDIIWVSVTSNVCEIDFFFDADKLQDEINQIEAACVMLRGLLRPEAKPSQISIDSEPEATINLLPETIAAIDDITSDREELDDDIPF